MLHILELILIRYPLLLVNIDNPTNYNSIPLYYLLGAFSIVLETALVLIGAYLLNQRYNLSKKIPNFLDFMGGFYLILNSICFLWCLLYVGVGSSEDPLIKYNETITTQQTEPKTIYKNKLNASLTINNIKFDLDLTYDEITNLLESTTIKLEKDNQKIEINADIEIETNYANQNAKKYKEEATYHVDKVTFTSKTTTTKWFKAINTNHQKIATVYISAKIDDKKINTQKELEKLVE